LPMRFSSAKRAQRRLCAGADRSSAASSPTARAKKSSAGPTCPRAAELPLSAAPASERRTRRTGGRAVGRDLPVLHERVSQRLAHAREWDGPGRRAVHGRRDEHVPAICEDRLVLLRAGGGGGAFDERGQARMQRNHNDLTLNPKKDRRVVPFRNTKMIAGRPPGNVAEEGRVRGGEALPRSRVMRERTALPQPRHPNRAPHRSPHRSPSCGTGRRQLRRAGRRVG
jgi:hypothetical protein